ncbi:hypothetical protein Tco_0200781 [Tanacetum coccineum]
MAQQQHAADVHPDELCPPNKRYDLMDANKKVDLEHVQCPPESKILTNIIKNHPLRFSIAASSSVPWIYMAQFWHTLKEDGSKYRLKFMLDKKELSLTLDDFRTIFHLPQNPTIMITLCNTFIFGHEHYRMYAEVFGLDVPLTQSQRSEYTQKNRLPAPVPTVDKADEMIFQVTFQIEKMVEGSENVIDDSLPPRNDEPKITGTRLEPKSDKESLVVEITNDEEVEITNVVIPVNVNEEEDENNDEELTVTDTQITSSSRSHHTKLSKANRLLSLFKAKPARFKRYKNFFQELRGRYTYLFKHLKERFLSRKSFDTLIDHLQDVMVKSLPTMVDTYIKKHVKKQVPEQVGDQVPGYVTEGLIMERQKTKEEMERMIAKAILQERGNIQAEISSQIQKAIDNHTSLHVDAFNDDEYRRSKCHKDIMEETSYHLTIDEDYVKENAFQRDPEVPALSLINQDLLYLKKGSSGPEKIVLSLHKFPTIIFNDVDIEERTSQWQEPGKPKEEVYLNLKIIQVVKTYWELGHEHKFIIEIVAKRANECIVSITEPDYKNLNKNDIEDISLVIWERVHDFQLGIESYQQKVNLTAPTISFLGVEKHKMFSIIYEPVHGIIYKNSKKDKRVMRHSEIHKFCDARRTVVLEGD